MFAYISLCRFTEFLQLCLCRSQQWEHDKFSIWIFMSLSILWIYEFMNFLSITLNTEHSVSIRNEIYFQFWIDVFQKKRNCIKLRYGEELFMEI